MEGLRQSRGTGVQALISDGWLSVSMNLHEWCAIFRDDSIRKGDRDYRMTTELIFKVLLCPNKRQRVKLMTHR